MPIHSFDFSIDGGADGGAGKKLVSSQFDPMSKDKLELRPAISPIPPKDGVTQTKIAFENQNIIISEETREILPQGYRTMDRGIKNYFSGIRVPTKDGIKLLQVRMSGGDKPYQIWAADIKRGRVLLPVMAIKREGEENFPEKFSPAHQHWMHRHFVDTDMTKIALTYRPVPAKINYTLSVWAEHKRDLEYILYQIRTRFNPIAEFYVEDEHLRMGIIILYNGMTPAVDDDVPAEQRANKRYDFSIQMEGYLPLPTRVVPSILGRVTTLKDGSERTYGDVFQTVEGKLDAPFINVRRPSDD